jgi:hypothetical protein
MLQSATIASDGHAIVTVRGELDTRPLPRYGKT